MSKFRLALVVDNTKGQEEVGYEGWADHLDRPRTRGGCEVCETCQHWRDEELEAHNGVLPCGHTEEEAVLHSRPCVFASCRHNLYLDVSKAGSLQFTDEDKEIEELEETCSLDVADKNLGLNEIAAIMNRKHQRLEQITWNAFGKIRGGRNLPMKTLMQLGSEIFNDA